MSGVPPAAMAAWTDRVRAVIRFCASRKLLQPHIGGDDPANGGEYTESTRMYVADNDEVFIK